jgi:cytochrome c oxidase assembly factor CtaG
VSHPVGPLPHAGLEASLLSWALEPVVVVSVLAAGLYLRGWITLSRRIPERFGASRLVAIMAGLATFVLALSPPLDALASVLLPAHMSQHLLLMMVAPPLLWMGAPVAPMLLGLPRSIRRWAALALASAPGRRLAHVLASPAVSGAAFFIVFWTWHVPALYDLALHSDFWHHVEHTCFFTTAMLFWRPVILPWPAHSSWPRWAMIPYLVLADLQNSVLAAVLTFSDRVIYSAYEAVPRAQGFSALEDQAIAGVIMWVPGSLTFLLPVLWIVATVATREPDRMRTAPLQ